MCGLRGGVKDDQHIFLCTVYIYLTRFLTQKLNDSSSITVWSFRKRIPTYLGRLLFSFIRLIYSFQLSSSKIPNCSVLATFNFVCFSPASGKPLHAWHKGRKNWSWLLTSYEKYQTVRKFTGYQIYISFSSVRSSYSHPDLLVIHHHHPTFSDHTGPQHWTFTFWATTAI